MSNIITLKTPASKVMIGQDVLYQLNKDLNKHFNASKKVILADENSMKYCVSYVIENVDALNEAEIIEINSGEQNKTLDIAYQIWKTLIEYKFSRNDVLINVGGGLIGDLGGFVASTYKRGMSFINLPTTLLAQVDASVGGKVGVNFESYKNIIGVFQEPFATYIYPGFLNTLDKRQFLSGFAEIIKHALIEDQSLWENLKNISIADFSNNIELIHKAISIKNDIVKKDPLEHKERKKLNFGHTIGHALESYAIKNAGLPLLHGEAVAIGIICESYLSLDFGLSKNEFDDIKQFILSMYPKWNDFPKDISGLVEYMKNDKKNLDENINFTVLKSIGNSDVDQHINIEKIIESLYYYKAL